MPTSPRHWFKLICNHARRHSSVALTKTIISWVVGLTSLKRCIKGYIPFGELLKARCIWISSGRWMNIMMLKKCPLNLLLLLGNDTSDMISSLDRVFFHSPQVPIVSSVHDRLVLNSLLLNAWRDRSQNLLLDHIMILFTSLFFYRHRVVV